jgi:hypothetical protein
MVPADGSEPRVFWGRTTRFLHTKTTRDQSNYEIVIEPHIGCVTPRTTHTYQNKSAPEIIEAILRRNDPKGVTIGDGSGTYLKLSGGKIILGSPAEEIELKGNLTVNDPEGGSFNFPAWSSVPVKDVQGPKNFEFSE